MKKLVLIALLVGFGAHAANKDAAVKGVENAAKAAKGGAAAVNAGGRVTKAVADLQKIIAGIRASEAPSEQQVQQFSAKLDVTGLNQDAKGMLVKAFKVTALDMGCTDKEMSAAALTNLAEVMRPIVEANIRAGSTVKGLARLAKYSDFDGVKGVSAEEDKASKNADDELIRQAKDGVAGLQKATNVDAKTGVQHFQTLGNQCGVAEALAARAAQAL